MTEHRDPDRLCTFVNLRAQSSVNGSSLDGMRGKEAGAAGEFLIHRKKFISHLHSATTYCLFHLTLAHPQEIAQRQRQFRG
jgi:hypothetical protein